MSIDKIAFLGDSLTDSDEFWRLSSQLLKEPLPDTDWYSTQFSNGKVHADILPDLIGLTGGEAYNYAFAGARAVGSRAAIKLVPDPTIMTVPTTDPRLQTDINLTAQTQRFLGDAATQGWDVSSFAVSLWIGLNDLATWRPSSISPWRWDDEADALVKNIAAAIATNVERLVEAGVGDVWVSTLPEGTFFPIYDELGWLPQLLSEDAIGDLNARLARSVAGLQAEGAPVRLLDMAAIAAEIEADPANFGFRYFDEPLLLTTGSEYDPERNPALPADFDFEWEADRIAFIDKVHPTEALHGVLAAFEAEAMTAKLLAFGGSDDTIAGSDGDDLVLAAGGDDVGRLGAGDDVALGGKGADRIWGGDGHDLVSGGAGDDELYGEDGHDLLFAGGGDDLFRGSLGQDMLIDSDGADELAGGEGNDWFLWFDPALTGRTAEGWDSISGGRGFDRLILCVAETATYADLLDELAARESATFASETLGLRVRGVEEIEVVDLARERLALPETGNEALDEQIAAAELWGFA